MKALVSAFNQEKALVGAFSVIVQPVVEPMDRFTALLPGRRLLPLRQAGAGPGGARQDRRQGRQLQGGAAQPRRGLPAHVLAQGTDHKWRHMFNMI